MSDLRRLQAETWAARELNWTDWQSEAISSDASFRRYFRLRRDGQAWVVMDAPPEREPVDAFVDIARRLKPLVHVPKIRATHIDQGLLLLEDLGGTPYHHRLTDDNADALFSDALGALLTLQSAAPVAGLPAFDAAMLMRELALFPDWFLARHWQLEPTDQELDDWDLLCALLIRWALDQPQVFCHRDFMPRNLMVAEPNPGIIDFQDAVCGPISYDPVCLFRDAFLSWPVERVDGWLEGYRQTARAAGLPITDSDHLWRRQCDFMGVQRHLKVLGIFARIAYRDGKPAYLDDAPRFFDYLSVAVERNPELQLLDELLGRWRARARPVK
ncbi:MAG: aminoglycoside phosphotransferase family protein [Wenzhouxiangella sp.]